MLKLVFEYALRAPGIGQREVCSWTDDRGRTFARAFAQETSRWIDWPGLGVFAFSAGSATVSVWPDAGVEASVIADAFARVLQPIILQALGRQALHASAVLGADGVLAFCGVARSGKSTLAYALGQDGYRQIADDALVLELAGPVILTRLLPFAPGLRPPSRSHFDGGQPCALTPSDSGCVAVAETAPLRAVFLLQQDDRLRRPEHVHRIPPVQAFSALLTHARCFDEADRSHTRRLVDDYLRVAESVPVWGVSYPPDFGQLSHLIEMIETVARDLELAKQPSVPQPRAAQAPAGR